MIRVFYFLRVFLFSLETIIIFGGVLVNDYFAASVQSLANAITLHENLENYLMVAPVAVGIWIFLEIRNLLQEDNNRINILTGWDGYWKLKTHTRVAITYSIIFVSMSLVPWCSEFSLKTRVGFSFFIIGLLGQLCVALSVYIAHIQIKEIIAKLS